MRFVINEHEYDAAQIDRITGIDALDLAKQVGFGVQTLAKRLSELAPAEDGTTVDPFDSEPHLRALLAFLWLSRRLSGERRLSFEEACDFPIMSLDIVDDTPEPEPEPEPYPT
jgi:hypothetical protein